MSNRVQLTIQENKILLQGDTFSLKEQIKQLGGRWNAVAKHWWMPHNEDNVSSLQKIGLAIHPESIAERDSFPSSLMNEKNIESTVYPQPVAQDSVVFKISELVQIIASVIQTQLPKTYWVYGEISSCKIANGHVFFDLIEKENQVISASSLRSVSISCVLWAGKKRALQQKFDEIPFADGTQIKIKVGLDFRKEGSRVVAIVEDLDTEHTKGNLLLQRLAIVKELKKRNLYHKNKSCFFKSLPLRVALITAENSRASADFLQELKLSGIAFQVVLFDCNMQGEKTEENVCQALKTISENLISQFDCAVITRGGGSRMDLRWFDNLEIAKHIAYCPVPVICAVGHFDDVSIADEVSFHTEKTPTAAARFLSQRALLSYQEMLMRVENLSRTLLKRFEKEKHVLVVLEQKIAFQAKRRIESERKNLEKLTQFIKIFQMSLEKTLQRGFALISNESGKLLTGKDFLVENYPKNLTLQMASAQGEHCQNIKIHVLVDKVTTHDDIL